MIVHEKGCYVIAEAGVNHNGSLEKAVRLVEVAAEAGADAVKFQSFKTENLVTKDTQLAAYQRANTGEEEGKQKEMLQALELSEKDHKEIHACCASFGIDFLSSPFDSESLDLLVSQFDLRYIKVASGEITNGPLLLSIAQASRPVLLSTGMSTLGEIEEALSVLAFGYIHPDHPPSRSAFRAAFFSEMGQNALARNVILLHCTSEYPAPYAEVNLKAMDSMRAAFGLPVGYSDHTQGIVISVAAVARGAAVIEKHFTLDRSLPGPDHKASLEPHELREMVQSIRHVEQAIGTGRKSPTPSEAANIEIVRKSLVANGPIKAGMRIGPNHINAKRPGSGISPMHYWDMIGISAQRDYQKDDLIEKNDCYF